MLTPDYLKGIPESIVQTMVYDVEDFIIEDIARRIRKMGTATSTAEIQRLVLQSLGEGIESINKKIAKALKITEKEVERIFAESLEIATDNQKVIAKKLGIPLNTEFAQRISQAAVKSAMGDLTNLTRMSGFVTSNGQFTMWTDAYRHALGVAQMRVASGAVDYGTAIRQVLKSFTGRGLCSITYQSGRTISLEAITRLCVINGVSDMASEVMKQNAEDLGTDGWEISAHIDCAPDHEGIQGRQFTNEEYEERNNNLARPIGALNCRHTAYPILLGISEPLYTKKQLEQMRQKNEKGFTYDGKHYTLYEADQRQRYMERAIRKTKRELLLADKAGYRDDFISTSVKLRKQRDIYADFSDRAGLLTQNERAQVAGYGRRISGKAVVAEKSMRGIVTSDGIKTDITRHVLDRAKQRGISLKDVPDTLKNPLKIEDVKIDTQGRPSKKYIGRSATVTVNPDNGNITTCYPTSSKVTDKLKGKTK